MAFLKAMFQTDAFAWGRCEDFFVIEEAGKLIAGASGFSMDKQDFRPLRAAHFSAMATVLGWDESARAQFWQRYEGVWSDPQDSSLAPPASWIIECVAVVPEKRGQGIAKTLLQALLAEGKRQGHTHAGISVTIGNEPAQKVYESLGFQMYMTYGAEYFDGAFPGTIKYRMRL
ncbi:MAG: GNAT family N-acetyltransferase [Chloroflexaceae bacterium]|jgi:ribosomal protein S18 acetylase RimI-like enzyme|nr:GNAT family N-acetyltransferase [Chloroflexaceae bacterium]